MLNDLAQDIYNTAVTHGWWDKERSFGEIIALCHSELSEALEEFRNGRPFYYEKDGKPEGIAAEMADCIIRILDWACHEDVDMDEVITKKMAYNEGRDYRHGNKTL